MFSGFVESGREGLVQTGPEVKFFFGGGRGGRVVEMKKPQPERAGAYDTNDESFVC